MSSKATTTLSTKGQVILPKSIRDALQWHPGARLTIEQTADGVLLKPEQGLFAPTRPDDSFGCLKDFARENPATIEEMQEAIDVGVRERHARGRY